MTQKLTLPLEVGKKYVRRDGTVVTARERHEDKFSTCLYVGEQDTAEYDRPGTVHAWKHTGLIYDKEQEHMHDIVADYVEGTGHPHAEAMMEYAKDAAIMAEPWKNWELRDSNEAHEKWHDCKSNPLWNSTHQYRRKQPKVTINGIIVNKGVEEVEYLREYFVCSLNRPEKYFTTKHAGVYLKHGIVHTVAEDAVAMAKAMLNFK